MIPLRPAGYEPFIYDAAYCCLSLISGRIVHFKNYEMVHRDTPSTVCANFAHTGDNLSKMQKGKSRNAEREYIKPLKYNKNKTCFAERNI